MAEQLHVRMDMGWDELISYGFMCLLSAAVYGLACWLGGLI